MKIQETGNTFLPAHKSSSCTLPSGSPLSHKHFLVQYALLSCPTFFCFHLLQKFFLNSSLTFPHSLLCLFLYCCFQLIFPKAAAAFTAQQSQQHRASGKQHCCCPRVPSSSHLWPADQLTGTFWSINKHICLAAGSWECESYCNPHKDWVIAEDWLSRVFLLKEAEDPLSLCTPSLVAVRFYADSSFRDCCSTCKQGLLLRIEAPCSCYWQQECVTVWHWCALG